MSDDVIVKNQMYDMSKIDGCGFSPILVDKQVGNNHFVVVHGGMFGAYFIINGVKNFIANVDVGGAIYVLLRYNDASVIVDKINSAKWGKELEGLKI